MIKHLTLFKYQSTLILKHYKIKFRLLLCYTNLQQYFQELSQKIYHWLAEKIVYCDCEKFNVVKCIKANTIVLRCLYTLEYSVEYLEFKNN
jgi:hypothetical protein